MPFLRITKFDYHEVEGKTEVTETNDWIYGLLPKIRDEAGIFIKEIKPQGITMEGNKIIEDKNILPEYSLKIYHTLNEIMDSIENCSLDYRERIFSEIQESLPWYKRGSVRYPRSPYNDFSFTMKDGEKEKIVYLSLPCPELNFSTSVNVTIRDKSYYYLDTDSDCSGQISNDFQEKLMKNLRETIKINIRLSSKFYYSENTCRYELENENKEWDLQIYANSGLIKEEWRKRFDPEAQSTWLSDSLATSKQFKEVVEFELERLKITWDDIISKTLEEYKPSL